MSARTVVIQHLAAIVASEPDLADTTVVPAVRDVGDINRPYLIVKTGTYTPTPEAPLRNMTWEGTVTLVSPHKDQERAEDHLEELLEALTGRLRTAALAWSGAQLTNFDDQHLSLDITLRAIFQKEQ